MNNLNQDYINFAKILKTFLGEETKPPFTTRLGLAWRNLFYQSTNWLFYPICLAIRAIYSGLKDAWEDSDNYF